VADASQFRFRQPAFSLVCAAFSTIFEVGDRDARAALYRSVFENLRDGGPFALDNSFHGTGDLADWGRVRPSSAFQFFRTFHKDGDMSSVEVNCYEAEAHGPDGLLVMTILLEDLLPDGQRALHTYTVTRYYATPEETERELYQAGFTQVEI